MADEGLSSRINGRGECGGPGSSRSGTGEGGMLVKVRVEEVFHGGAGTEMEDDTMCLEVVDAVVEAVGVIRKGGGIGEEGRGKSVIAERTTKEVSASSKFSVGVAIQRE